MIELLMQMLTPEYYPEFVTKDVVGRFGGNVDEYVKWLYETSRYANKERLTAYAATLTAETQETSDPAAEIYKTSATEYFKLEDMMADAQQHFAEGRKLFIAGLHEMEPDVKRYPDANLTLRLTYGNVKPYSPADAVFYNYSTTLTGVIEKEDPANPTEFAVPARLKQLYEAADYGRYADYTGLTKKDIRKGATGHLNTCFISTNDITGGNSGSPILNSKGQLMGLAFDGNWDAMSGDVLFEQDLQRCINVDVRYVLFVIDKFAGAGHLLDEMTIEW